MKNTKKKKRREYTSKFYYKNHINYIMTILTLVSNAMLIVGVTYLLERGITIAVSGSINELIHLILLSIIFIVGMMVNWLLECLFRNRFIERAEKQYKAYIFSKVINKKISSFMSEPTGRYISVLTNDMAVIEQNYIQSEFDIILNTLYILVSITMMFWFSWLLTVYAIGLSIISFVISLILSKSLIHAEKKVSEKNETFVSMIKDLLNGFPVIKSFKAENEVSKLFMDRNKNLEQKKCKRRRQDALINTITNSVSMFVQVGVILIGAFLTIKGTITVGILAAFLNLMVYLLPPIQIIPKTIANRRAAIGLINKSIESVSHNTSCKGKESLKTIQDGIYFNNVTFGYSKESILKCINLTLESGKSYAIVGSSGSGKSTLLNLLLGSYDNYDGEILFDNIELREIKTESLYDIISVVQQNVFIFDNSVESNITMFKTFPTQKVNDVINLAGLTQLIQEKGLNYKCGENGSGLSGGEKQRISIARSLLQETPVLLFDEATAALDASTAFMVEDSILKIKSLTRIIVTHKINKKLLLKYDKIVVMSKGRIVEQGNFEDLIENQGYFYSLYMVSAKE